MGTFTHHIPPYKLQGHIEHNSAEQCKTSSQTAIPYTHDLQPALPTVVPGSPAYALRPLWSTQDSPRRGDGECSEGYIALSWPWVHSEPWDHCTPQRAQIRLHQGLQYRLLSVFSHFG